MADSSSWTAPSDKVQYGVYLGTWTNWSRGGRILGATLTLDSRYGLLLLSFTATFVGFVASRFWRIITLVLHRIYSTPEPRDALHHQRQVVLRNSVSAVSTLWTSLQLAWCWRAVADGYLGRILPTIIFAASAFCAFTIAGGFTSSISSGIGNDVLIDGSQCGLIYGPESTAGQMSTLYPWVSQNLNNAANYAQQCYSSNATGTLDCTTFVRSRLQFKSDPNASCPFSDNICYSNDSNLLLDSGLISSDDLGLNLPSDQRMFWRGVLHCAPLRTDGFTSNARTEYANYTRYWYGDSARYKADPNHWKGDHRTWNWTYEAESLDAKYKRQVDNPTWYNTQGFNVIPLKSPVANGTVWVDQSHFIPIPQLSVSDGDLMLIFLSPEGVFFLNQTDDSWYHATATDAQTGFRDGSKSDLYMPDKAASPMGCVQRFQYCDSSKKCGSLASFADAATSALPLFDLNPSDVWSQVESNHPTATSARFEMFQATMYQSQELWTLLSTLGPSSLLSRQHLMQGFMGPLPDNQWQLDVNYWFSIRLASIQAAFVNIARGPNSEALLPYVERPSDMQRVMCNNQVFHRPILMSGQKILSTDYISLSLFGLYFTYVTGIVIILASYGAEPLLALIYSRRKYNEYKYLEWAANGTLQLQRLAYQGLGSEKWSHYSDDIPKTRPGYFLADLVRAYPEDNDDEVQEVKPTVPAKSTTTASVSEASANLRVSEQSRGSLSRPVSAVSELVPHIVSTQVAPSQAVSPQAVSPISQHPRG